MRFGTKFFALLKIFYVNLLWHREHPYGYCQCVNWQSCVASGWTSCVCIRHKLPCSYIFSVQTLETISKTQTKGAKLEEI